MRSKRHPAEQLNRGRALADAALSTTGDLYWGNALAARDHGVQPFAAAAVAPEAGIAGRLAQLLSVVRKQQKKHFPGAPGSDSCWAVLLQLYASHVYQHRIHIQTLTERSGVPGTTVLRALDTLIAAGFVARTEDRFDRRRVFVELTDKGAESMKECLLNSGSRAALF
jgi:DNA-binding MarR family transcriptional regulator